MSAGVSEKTALMVVDERDDDLDNGGNLDRRPFLSFVRGCSYLFSLNYG